MVERFILSNFSRFRFVVSLFLYILSPHLYMVLTLSRNLQLRALKIANKTACSANTGKKQFKINPGVYQLQIVVKTDPTTQTHG